MQAKPAPAADTRRIILLGASNLTLGLATVLGLVRDRHGPCDILVAAGHGRSYGRPSSVLGRSLVGILDSGLWSAASGGASTRRPRALITDIGNDLAYGASPAEIAGWIERCLRRLGELDAEVGITLPPVANLYRLRRWQFRLIRSLLFPGRELGYWQMRARAAELHTRLATLARRQGAHLCEPRPEWFGVDGIHLRSRRRREAWSEMLGACRVVEHTAPAKAGRRPRWRRLTPQRQTILGRERMRSQPSRRLDDGTRVSFF